MHVFIHTRTHTHAHAHTQIFHNTMQLIILHVEVLICYPYMFTRATYVATIAMNDNASMYYMLMIIFNVNLVIYTEFI